MSMNVRKCWEGNPCPSGETCHSSGADMTGQGICVSDKPHSTPTHLNISYSCEGNRCVLQQRPPTGDGMSGPYYGTMARCQAYCNPHHPSGLISYDCNNGVCDMRHDANGRYSSKAECEAKCVKGSLHMAWKCAKGHKPGARCVKVPGFADGKTLFADEASCENNTTCGAVPVKLLTEPDWAIGVSEGNPLEMISTANVGNIHNAVINYM